MANHVSRRVLLSGLIFLPFAACTAAGRTGDPLSFSSVKTDVSVLKGRGLHEWSNILSSAMKSEASRAFPRKANRTAPHLVIKITDVFLNSFAGNGEGGDSKDSSTAGQTNDYLDGEALIVDQRGNVIKRLPQLTVLPSSRAGAWYAPDADTKRLKALAKNYVLWLERRL